MTMVPPSYPSLIPPACQVCRKPDGLVFCRNCQVVPYCGWVHHREHQLDHLEACLVIGDEMVHVEMEEQKLQRMSPNPFETEAGRFCRTSVTRPYMQIKFGLVVLLIQKLGYVGGQHSVVDKVRIYCYEMLRLNRSDIHSVRHLVAALDIRLGRDQAAYDLIKWFATTGADDEYRWNDVELPYLDVENANMLESTEGWWANLLVPDMGHSIPLALIKLRLLFDLQVIQAAKRHLGRVLPPELIDKILYDAVSSSTGTTVKRQVELLQCSLMDRARMIQTLKGQIIRIYKSIHMYNRFFWPLMLDGPDLNTPVRHNSYAYGRPDEALTMAVYNYASWAETPRAMETVQTLASVP